MATTQIENVVNYEQEIIVRPLANFSPSLWGDLFTSASSDENEQKIYTEEIEALKKEVRSMIVSADENMAEKLLRQYGHNISSGIFDIFIDGDGKFKNSLNGDVRGLLSLYEAANVRTHGDDILNEAFVFSSAHLESIAPNLSSPLEEEVKHALEKCLQQGIPRVEALHFMSIYEIYEPKIDSFFRLAKLDFNLLQVLHRKELCEVSKWWKDLDLVSKLLYARDRVVECHFWTLGVYFEPQSSRVRTMLAKTIAMISVIDDTYDSYGTVEELAIFTDAIDRWDINEIDRLPEYIKICYRALLDLYDQYEEELRQQGRSFVVHYAKATMKEIVRSYNIEAKWFIEGYMPPFDDYMTNGFITSLLIEKNRGQSVTGIDCYTKQNGVSEEEAMNEFNTVAENAWKVINEECVKEDTVSMEILKRVVHLSRLIDVVYKHNQDGYTHPEKVLKPLISALLVDSFDII